MKLHVTGAALLILLLHPAVAWPQGAHSSHGGPAPKVEQAPAAKGDAKPAAKADAKPAADPQPVAPNRDCVSYRSPFTGYRPFAPDEAMTQWRTANDEVRDSGGRVGLMKGKQ